MAIHGHLFDLPIPYNYILYKISRFIVKAGTGLSKICSFTLHYNSLTFVQSHRLLPDLFLQFQNY